MTMVRVGASFMGIGFLFAGSLGCVARRDLSAYSEGAASEEGGPLQSPSAERVGDSEAPTPEVTPGPIDTPDIEQENPTNAALDPAPADPESTEPESSEPEPEPEPAESAPTGPSAPPPSVDPTDTCDATDEFTIPASSSCYLLGAATNSWQGARNVCQTWGGDLVEIGTPEENAALTERIVGSVWIGANDQNEEGTFRWASGIALELEVWAAGQPDDFLAGEDCGELRDFDGAWNDAPCTSIVQRPILCERPPRQ